MLADMLLTTHFMTLVLLTVWKLPLWVCAAFYIAFAPIEATFWSSTLTKVPYGAQPPASCATFSQHCMRHAEACTFGFHAFLQAECSLHVCRLSVTLPAMSAEALRARCPEWSICKPRLRARRRLVLAVPGVNQRYRHAAVVLGERPQEAVLQQHDAADGQLPAPGRHGRQPDEHDRRAAARHAQPHGRQHQARARCAAHARWDPVGVRAWS